MYLGRFDCFAERFLVYVHVVHRASDEVRRFRTFKERLTQSPALLAEYCACKRQLVTDGVADTDDYAVRKRPFIHKVLGNQHGLKPTGV